MRSSFSRAARRSSTLSAAISDLAWLIASLCATLRFMVGDLLAEAITQIAATLHALESDAGQVILFLVHGQFGLAHPFRHFVSIFFLLLFQQMLIGDGN